MNKLFEQNKKLAALPTGETELKIIYAVSLCI